MNAQVGTFNEEKALAGTFSKYWEIFCEISFTTLNDHHYLVPAPQQAHLYTIARAVMGHDSAHQD